MAEPLDIEAELLLVVDALGAAGVDDALCGGLALAVHGFPRATKDIDVLVDSREIERAFIAVKSAGFTLRAGPMPLGVGTPNPQRLFRATKVVGNGHLTLDLLEVSPSYLPAWSSRVTGTFKGRPLTVVTREGLIAKKRLSSRGKDRADIETLEASNEEATATARGSARACRATNSRGRHAESAVPFPG
jgi:hypothetical protein